MAKASGWGSEDRGFKSRYPDFFIISSCYNLFMSFLLIFLLFLIWRVSDFIIIFFSQKVIPYLGFFSYKDDLLIFKLPNWLSSLANFDGIHYIKIAEKGYSQYEQAFFPLYPILIKFLTLPFFNNKLLIGIIISNMSFLLGLFFFYRYLKLIFPNNRQSNKLTIVLLLLFPTSFFFGAVYTEGLFFLLLILVLYFLKKERYLMVIIFAFLTSLTRIVGVFVIIPILFHLIQKLKVKSQNIKFILKSLLYLILNIKYFLLVLSPILGLAAYCFYLLKTTGDPFFFFSSQPAFGASRSTHLISFLQVYWRYFKIFITARWNFQYFVSIIEFSFFSFVLIILVLDLFKNLGIKNLKFIKNCKLKIENYEFLGLNLFSLINLILPTLTGTFLSIPRFSLMSLSLFIYLSLIKNTVVKYLILIIFLILHILLLGFFTQGYFIS